MAHGPVPDEGLPHRDVGESCTPPGGAFRPCRPLRPLRAWHRPVHRPAGPIGSRHDRHGRGGRDETSSGSPAAEVVEEADAERNTRRRWADRRARSPSWPRPAVRRRRRKSLRTAFRASRHRRRSAAEPRAHDEGRYPPRSHRRRPPRGLHRCRRAVNTTHEDLAPVDHGDITAPRGHPRRPRTQGANSHSTGVRYRRNTGSDFGPDPRTGGADPPCVMTRQCHARPVRGRTTRGGSRCPAATDSVPREVTFVPPATRTVAGSWNSSRSHTETRRPPERGDHRRQTHTAAVEFRGRPRLQDDPGDVQYLRPVGVALAVLVGVAIAGFVVLLGVWFAAPTAGVGTATAVVGTVARADTASAAPEVPGDPPVGDYRP